MRHLYLFFVVVLGLGGFSYAATTYELDAKQFLSDASARYFKYYDDLAEQTYLSSEGKDFEEIFRKLDNLRKIDIELANISIDARKYDLKKIDDVQIKRALLNVRKAGGLFVLGEDYITSVLLFMGDIEEFSTDKEIEPYSGCSGKPSKECPKLALFPDIQKIFEESHNPEELKYYWEEWRKKNLAFTTMNLNIVVQAFHNASKILGITELSLWYRNYKNGNFLMEMDSVMQELKPAYQQLHAFVRQELFNRYGADHIDPNGPIPAHLFEKVMKKVWKAGGVFDAYFPFKDLPPVDDFVKHFKPEQIIEEAERFFTSLGFEELGEDFHRHQMRKHDASTNIGNCRADVFDKTPHVYMKYCEKVDFRKFLQNHGYVSRAFYAREKKDLPAYFFGSYGLQYPVGEAVILSASTPAHMKRIGLAKDFDFTEKILMNRLFRMSIHTLFNIPLFFVHTKVMNDLLDDTVKVEDANKHYWKAMEQYVGVEPPSDRPEGAIDFSYEFYLDMEQNRGTKKFISEILGYQFYRAFCKRSSHVGPLHNCDFYGSVDVGNDLKAMMSLGSSRSWREVVGKVLGRNPRLSAEALLEYYAPILDWIKTQNDESKLQIGWNVSQKKVL